MSLRTSVENSPAQSPASLKATSIRGEGSPARVAKDYFVLVICLCVVGFVSVWIFYSRSEILLSGDAVAHINIARRVFDSRTPGPLQLGSVWLPLPHLLTIPFVISDRLWRSGLGGSVISVLSYILAGLGLFRLLSIWSRFGAWIGTAFFAANPNLIFVQATALNEPLYLAAFIWTVVFFIEAGRSLQRGELAGAGRLLEKAAITVTAAIFTRYDGWFLAVVCWIAMLPAGLKARHLISAKEHSEFRKSVFKALLLTALGPTLWMAYNFGVYENPLDFATGPYSAKAIAERSTAKDSPPYPGERRPWTAGVYFTKAAQLNVGENGAAKLLVLLAALAGILLSLRDQWMPVVLLWSPLLFYTLSIAYGSVPIFLPVWWPFSYYNVRYGLELLPAIAVGIAVATPVIAKAFRAKIAGPLLLGLILIATSLSYASSWRSTPICLREVRRNGSARMELDRRLAGFLAWLPPNATVLAYTGAHSGAFELAGFHLRRTINEGNYGRWESALQHPASAANYVVAVEGDPVAKSVAKRPEALRQIAGISIQGEGQVVVYRSLHQH